MRWYVAGFVLGLLILASWGDEDQLRSSSPPASRSGPLAVGGDTGPLAAPFASLEGQPGDSIVLRGRANYADPGHGPDYLAIRYPRGTSVRICGDGGCRRMISTDYGPAKRTGDIADIALVRFAAICGWTIEKASAMGECDVTIEVGAKAKATLPPTDME